MKCRHCSAELKHTFVDLGSSPPSNSYLSKEALKEAEQCYPLKVMVCDHCWLVQTEDFVKVDTMFASDYAYFSSYSTSWLDHAHRYVNMIIERFGYNEKSKVIEIASNDGYLLQYFQKKNIPVLGIEPSKNVAHAAREKGIETIIDFFSVNLFNFFELPSSIVM